MEDLESLAMLIIVDGQKIKVDRFESYGDHRKHLAYTKDAIYIKHNGTMQYRLLMKLDGEENGK